MKLVEQELEAENLSKDYKQGKKERCIKVKCVMLFGCRCFGNKILLTRELGTMSTIGTSFVARKIESAWVTSVSKAGLRIYRNF